MRPPRVEAFRQSEKLVRRLLESIRFLAWEESWFDPEQAQSVRIALDSS